MQINLEELHTMSVDISKFPGATLELRRDDNTLMAKMEYKTHSKAQEVLFEIQEAWHFILLKRHNEQIKTKSETLEEKKT